MMNEQAWRKRKKYVDGNEVMRGRKQVEREEKIVDMKQKRKNVNEKGEIQLVFVELLTEGLSLTLFSHSWDSFTTTGLPCTAQILEFVPSCLPYFYALFSWYYLGGMLFSEGKQMNQFCDLLETFWRPL